MRLLLTLASLTFLPLVVATPAHADQTYYCVERVTIAVGTANRDVTTPAICMYAPPAPTP